MGEDPSQQPPDWWNIKGPCCVQSLRSRSTDSRVSATRENSSPGRVTAASSFVSGIRVLPASEFQHHSAVDLGVLHLVENGVDLGEFPGGNGGVDLALGVEIEGFLQILPGANNRAADGQALEHNLKDRCREIPRRQTVENNGSAA